MTSAERQTDAGRDSSDHQADELMVEACQRGDRAAQTWLYERYGERVFQLMVRMVGIQDAADMTQQVFLQVYRKIHSFSGRSRFSTWLYRVAVNEALQQRRKNQRRQLQPLHLEPTSTVNAAHAYEEREAFERALASIDAELRAIFLLREVDQLSYAELAGILELPEGTIASRLNRARRELRAALLKFDAA